MNNNASSITSKLLNEVRDLTKDLTKPSATLVAFNIQAFERKTKHLRDLILSNEINISKSEVVLLRKLICNHQQLSVTNDQKLLVILGLASLLEPLIEREEYAQEIEIIVMYLLYSTKQTFKYAALDIIAAGLGITFLADQLLIKVKLILADEPVGYVKDYLDTLS